MTVLRGAISMPVCLCVRVCVLVCYIHTDICNIHTDPETLYTETHVFLICFCEEVQNDLYQPTNELRQAIRKSAI